MAELKGLTLDAEGETAEGKVHIFNGYNQTQVPPWFQVIIMVNGQVKNIIDCDSLMDTVKKFTEEVEMELGE